MAGKTECMTAAETGPDPKTQTPFQPGKAFSLIAGTTACNARFPFCISKTTPLEGMGPMVEPIRIERLAKACELAVKNGFGTALITGKGEPLLYPEQISQYLSMTKRYGFDRAELQTNAILFGEHYERMEPYLQQWFEEGLKVISISISHDEAEKNREIYTPGRPYIDLAGVIGKLHPIGFAVRLSCVLLKDFIDTPEKARKLIDFASDNQVEQLTLRPLWAAEESIDADVTGWTREHALSKMECECIKEHVASRSEEVASFSYGATLYAFGERKQNVCLTNDSSIPDYSQDIRHLIFFPDGHVKVDWRDDGGLGERMMDEMEAESG